MGLLILIILIFAMILSVEVRIFVRHPIKTIYYLLVDPVLYIHDRGYDAYKAGQLNCYFAHFGGGKTLSVVHYVRYLFERYNNKCIYDRRRKKWDLQKVHILSNVKLEGVPFEPLTGLKQIVNYAWEIKKIDDQENTRTVILALVDEASSELNSRQFQSNIDANFLNALVTSRHFNMSFLYTSQKFSLVDKLLRSVTQTCIWCSKRWRFMVQHFFDADEMEYASNPALVQPRRRKGFFVSNKDYNTYDTLATVERLDKATTNGDMLSAQEILALRGEINPDNDNVIRPSRKLKKVRKKTR